jgi:hypothetical protein
VSVQWRDAPSEDMVLCTLTADGTLRVFAPVLDAPQRLQLHAALDAPAAATAWVDHATVRALVARMLAGAPGPGDARARRLQELADGGADLVLRVHADGAVSAAAVAVRMSRCPRAHR